MASVSARTASGIVLTILATARAPADGEFLGRRIVRPGCSPLLAMSLFAIAYARRDYWHSSHSFRPPLARCRRPSPAPAALPPTRRPSAQPPHWPARAVRSLSFECRPAADRAPSRPPEQALAERAEALERLRRVRSARADVAADDDRRLVGDLLQHGLQGMKVPMEVVEGRDAHFSRCSRAEGAVSSATAPAAFRARLLCGR
jgi:hypothetical protein